MNVIDVKATSSVVQCRRAIADYLKSKQLSSKQLLLFVFAGHYYILLLIKS